MNDNNILAVVLAGGQSRRFGKDKNQVNLGDMTLLEHVLKKISVKFKKILVVSNHNHNLENNDKITIIPDCIPGNLGPLVGVLSAMKWINENNLKYEWIATFPSDTPFFDNSIIDKYKLRMKSSKKLLHFIKSNKKRHNIFGLWSIKLLDILEIDLVNKNFRKVEDWANKIGADIIDIKIDKFDPFFNINTIEDLEEAKKIMKIYNND